MKLLYALLSLSCFLAASMVLYAASVAALHLGWGLGAFGFVVAGALWVAGLKCSEGGR